MPESLNLSSEKLERHGAYLLEDGQNIFIWIGRQVSPQLCIDLLDVRSYEEIRAGKVYNILNYNEDISYINVLFRI